MGHSATIPAITKLEDALEYIEGVDNGESGELGSVVSNGSPYHTLTKPIFDWIDKNNMEYNISSMGEILANRSDLAMQITIEDIAAWNSLAADIINENIPQPSIERDLMHIDYDEVMQNMTRVRNSSVNEFINSSTQPCRLKGRTTEDLKLFLDGYEDADSLIDLLSHGQQSIMKPSFKANGGIKIKQSSSYEKAKSLCHHAIANLYKKGRVAL
jgi:hypothetical protein